MFVLISALLFGNSHLLAFGISGQFGLQFINLVFQRLQFFFQIVMFHGSIPFPMFVIRT